MPGKQTPDSALRDPQTMHSLQVFGDLRQRQVRRLLDQRQDLLHMRLNRLRAMIAALPARPDIARPPPLINQLDGSPSCKIIDDLYHQQVTEGNLIPNIDHAYGEIAYFQVGDNPGRNEPGTGEINYRNVFAHIHNKNFTGVVGMEHGNSRPGRDGERAVINAYRHADSF